MIDIQVLQILLVASTAIAIGATIPQLIRLIKVKSARELSLRSYMVWTCTQCVSLVYMISLGDLILVVASGLWVSYYAIMIGLIFHYRRVNDQSAQLAVEPLIIENI